LVHHCYSQTVKSFGAVCSVGKKAMSSAGVIHQSTPISGGSSADSDSGGGMAMDVDNDFSTSPTDTYTTKTLQNQIKNQSNSQRSDNTPKENVIKSLTSLESRKQLSNLILDGKISEGRDYLRIRTQNHYKCHKTECSPLCNTCSNCICK
jgi:hypothetical protein